MRNTACLCALAWSSAVAWLGGCSNGLADDGPEFGASAEELTVPSGYTPYATHGGVQCYRQLVLGGAPDYVCAVDLRRSRVRTIHAAATGTLGSQRFNRETLSQLWSDGAAFEGGGMTRALAVNASFFGTNENPTTGLAFPYKQDGAVLTYGSDCSRHVPSVRNLHLWWDRQYAAVGTFDCSTYDQQQLSTYGSAPDIIGTLDTSYPKDPTSGIPRTFVGVHDRDGDGKRETLLVYSSRIATQEGARRELTRFGAQEIVMLDGGGSSGFIVEGQMLITPGRTIPNALVVYSAP